MITSGSASMLNQTILLGSQVMSSYCDVNTSLTLSFPKFKEKIILNYPFHVSLCRLVTVEKFVVTSRV